MPGQQRDVERAGPRVGHQAVTRTDVRRDGAYTIFYVGINLGAALGSLLCGYLGQTYGWAYGFGLAGVGMLLRR